MFHIAIVLLASVVLGAQVKVYHSVAIVNQVDVCVETSALVKNLPFKEASYYFTVAAGTYNIAVHQANTNACTGTLYFNQSVTVGTDPYYTVIAHGGLGGAPLALLAVVDNNDVAALDSAIRFIHTCAGAPNVDILVAGDPLFSNVAYGSLDSDQTLAPATYSISVRITGTTTIVVPAFDFTTHAGTTYTVFASGDASVEVFAVATIDFTSQRSNVKVIHAVAEVGAPAVDVYVNGVNAIPNFKYGNAVGYVELPSLQTTIDVTLSGTTTSVLAAPLVATLAIDADYSIVAHGSTVPISLLVLTDDNTAPTAGNAKIRFVHASAGSPAVDVLVNGEVAYSNYAYGEYSDYEVAPKGNYDISVVLTGTDTVVVSAKELTISSTEVATVYAIGIAGESGSLALKALPLEDSPVSRVLTFNSAAGALPSFFLLIASLILSLTLF